MINLPLALMRLFLRLPPIMVLLAMTATASVHAMTEIAEEELGGFTGEGLVFPFEDIRFQMAPTSYIELTGVPFTYCTGGTAAAPTPVGCASFLQRGDLRYYGLTMSRGTSPGTSTIWNTGGTNWNGGACNAGTFGLGCPMTSYGIGNYSNFDNPFVLRVFQYNRMGYFGTNIDQTVLEFLGPSNMDAFRWAFWGEIESGRVENYATDVFSSAVGTLQSQNIVLGKPAAYLKPPSICGTAATGTCKNTGGGADAAGGNSMQGPILRLFQDNQTESLGLSYISRLSGDFRFSVNQANAANARTNVPTFTDEEGMYMRNVNAYLPLGQLNYQSLTFNNVAAGNGNFVLDLTAIPDTPAVFNDFYQLPTALAATAQCNAACQTQRRGYNRVTTAIPVGYYDTHAYVEWGDKFPTNGNSNGMGGSGVSGVRFSGVDPDGLARAVNAVNFPGNICGTTNGSLGAQICARYSNQITGTKIISNSFGNGSANARNELLAQGGVVFMSSSTASTWTVLNNQNAPIANSGETLRHLVQTQVSGAAPVGTTPGGTTACANTNTNRCLVVSDWTTQQVVTGGGSYTAQFNTQNPTYNPLLTVNAINLGANRVEGMLINHLRITSLGAN